MTHMQAAKLKKRILKMVMKNMPHSITHEEVLKIAREFYNFIMEGISIEEHSYKKGMPPTVL